MLRRREKFRIGPLREDDWFDIEDGIVQYYSDPTRLMVSASCIEWVSTAAVGLVGNDGLERVRRSDSHATWTTSAGDKRLSFRQLDFSVTWASCGVVWCVLKAVRGRSAFGQSV